jgi:hypothetical protein
MDMLRASCVIGAIVFLLPTPQDAQFTSSKLMESATTQFSDLALLCSVNSVMCETASGLMATIEAKVSHGADLVSAWVEEATSRGTEMVAGFESYADMIQTGSITWPDEASLRGPLFPDS